MTDLKPCVCGAPARNANDIEYSGTDINACYWVECTVCPINSSNDSSPDKPLFTSPEAAADHWNSRPDTTPAQIEAAARALARLHYGERGVFGGPKERWHYLKDPNSLDEAVELWWSDFTTKAEVALEAAGTGQVNAWQPIETAPRDEERVLLYSPKYGPSTGHFSAMTEVWHLHSVLNLDEQPTHWMPLPEPPNKAREAIANVKGEG